MIQVLNNYFLDPRPKVPIFPKDLPATLTKAVEWYEKMVVRSRFAAISM